MALMYNTLKTDQVSLNRSIEIDKDESKNLTNTVEQLKLKLNEVLKDEKASLEKLELLNEDLAGL